MPRDDNSSFSENGMKLHHPIQHPMRPFDMTLTVRIGNAEYHLRRSRAQRHRRRPPQDAKATAAVPCSSSNSDSITPLTSDVCISGRPLSSGMLPVDQKRVRERKIRSQDGEEHTLY